MTKLFRNTSAMALIAGLTLPAVAKSKVALTPEHALNINVRVYNYANVTGGVLAKAQSEAARIFRRSGIETHWVDALSLAARLSATTPAQQSPEPPTSKSASSPGRWRRS